MILKNRNFYINLLIIFIIYFINEQANWTADPKSQFAQYLDNNYADWHPPLMAFLWGNFSEIFGKNIFYYVNLIFYGYGVFLIGEYFDFKKSENYYIFLVVIYTIVLKENLITYLWKDVGMLSAYTISIGLMLNNIDIKKKYQYGLIIILLFYASNLRSNSIFTLLFLLFLLNYIFFKRYSLVITIITYIGMITLSYTITYNILNSKKTYPQQYIMISDIVHLKERGGNVILPEYLTEDSFRSEEFKKNFNIQTPKISGLVFKKNYFKIAAGVNIENNKNFYKVAQTLESYQGLKSSWKESVLKNKKKYFVMKCSFFLKLIKSYGIFFLLNTLNFLFYIVFFKRKKKKEDIIFILISLSSISYIGTYFIFNASYDYRYISYFLVSSFITFIYFLKSLELDRE